ncbi:MAG: hypothetical protein J6S38_03945 [Erysipelotrichaceae bacterium]|nr:hypothetical protein [Erysipelotrichaceae bacterium]MBP5279737.1 hypothetical protein [Erysipelotrichaceae bacterium]
MKQYIYKKQFYNFKVVFTGYFVILIFFLALYALITSGNYLWSVVIVVCIYQFINTFVSLSNPEEVDIDDKYIAFKGFGKEHKYYFTDIKDFRVKEMATSKKIYLRINKDDFSLFKGRYWIDCYYFNDSDELFMYFVNKEDEIHPDTIKAYAHRSNQLTPQQKEEIQKIKKQRKEKSIIKNKGDKE